MYINSDITKLIKKKIEGTITVEELSELEKIVAQNPSIDDLLVMLDDDHTLLEDATLYLNFFLEKEERQNRLEECVFSKIQVKPKVNPFRVLLPYASIFFVVVFSAVLYFKFLSTHPNAIVLDDLKPGSNRASITLSDGQVIQLRQDKHGVVLGEQLQYEDGSVIQSINEGKVVYATIATPKGGQYQIKLSDGTKVWLNADSKLTYPSVFKEGSRIVELEGEAYFDVTTVFQKGEKMPFIVKTNRQEVEVLGTEFNVKAYADDLNDHSTTLVEGAVRLHAGGEVLALSPGYQGVVEASGLRKRQVDVGLYTSWKENKFSFEDLELREVVKILSRWYDFDYNIDADVKAIHIYANINRGKSFKEVLKIFERSGIKFRLERVGERNKLLIFN